MSRDHVVSVRLTDAEFEQLHDRAERAGRSVSDVARDRLFPTSLEILPSVTYPQPMRYGTVTVPSPGNVIWLSPDTPGRIDGSTLTLSAA